MIMSFRAAALTLLLVLPSPQVAAQSKELRIGVDRRVELIAIIFKLAGSGEFSPTHLPQYSADIDRFFGPQRNHEAVTLARGLRDRYGVAQSRVMAIPIRLTDPPELKERVPFDSSGGWPAPPAETRRFVEAARRFAIDSRANDFFTSHRTLYDSVDGRIRPALERAVDLAWFAPYFGIPSDRIFVVVPFLVAAEGNYGPCVQPPSGPRECYSIVGNTPPDATGYPKYDAGMAGLLVHEFGHGFVNPLGNAHRAEFERSAPRIHALVAAAMDLQSYPWPSMVNESLDRATEARYIVAHGDSVQLRAFYRDQLRGSWFWTEELANLYAQYEANRTAYPTFAAFLPRIIAYSIRCPIAFRRCRRATTSCGPRSCHCPSRMDRTPWIRAYRKWWCDSTGRCGTTVGASCRCWDPPAQRPSRTSASPSLRGGQSTPRASPSPLERGWTRQARRFASASRSSPTANMSCSSVRRTATAFETSATACRSRRTGSDSGPARRVLR